MFQLVDTIPFRIKGEVLVEVERNGILVDTRKQNNLWLDRGTRDIILGNEPSKIFVSDSTVQPQYTDTEVPAGTQNAFGNATRTYQQSVNGVVVNRHEFYTQIAPPTSGTRTINTIGLTRGGSGVENTLAFAYLVLTAPIVQTTLDTLHIYYYVYILQPNIQGIGHSGWNDFAESFFGYKNYSLYVSRQLFYGAPKNDMKWDGYAFSQTDSRYIYNTEVIDENKYKVYFLTNFGSSSDLSSYVGHLAAFSVVRSSYYYLVKNIIEDGYVGRFWPKRNTSTEPFFDSGSSQLPQGWSKGAEIRATNPFAPEYLGIFYKVNIVTTGDVGASEYYVDVLAPYYPSTGWGHMMLFDFVNKGGSSYVIRSGIISKLGRDFIITSYINNTTGEYYTTISDLNGGGYVDIIGDDTASCKIWIHGGGTSDLFFYDQKNRDKFFKVTFNDPVNVFDNSLTEYTSARDIFHAEGDSSKIYLWHHHDGVVGVFDVATGVISDTWIDRTSFLLDYTTVGDDMIWEWGLYDSVNSRILIGVNKSVFVYPVDGVTELNGFTGVADFNSTTIKNWSAIIVKDGTLAHNAGNLEFGLSHGKPVSGTNNGLGTLMLQRVSPGAFDVVVKISSFSPTDSNQRMGMIVCGSHDNIDTQKRIERGGGNIIEAYTDDVLDSGGSASYSKTDVWFRIERDASNNVSVYYADPSVGTWNQLGVTTVMSGEVYVGLTGHTRDNGATSLIQATVSDFYFNTGTVDKRQQSVYIDNTILAATAQSGIVKLYNGIYHIITDVGVVAVNANSFDKVKDYKLYRNTDSNGKYGYFIENYYNGKYFGVAKVSLLYQNYSNKWDYDSRFANTYEVQLYEPLVDEYMWVGGFESYKQVLTMIGLNLIKNYQSSTPHSYADGQLRFEYVGGSWVLTDSDNASPTPKVTHSAWEALPSGSEEIRFLDGPTPGQSHVDGDMYTSWCVSKGLIKDNQEYITNIGMGVYFSDAQRANETYTNIGTVVDMESKLNNPATWLIADFDYDYDIRIRNADGTPSCYYNVVSMCNVSSVSSNSEFSSDTADLYFAYNFYKRLYVKFVTGANAGVEPKQILEYDGYNKKIITDTWPNAISIGDKFDIVDEGSATKVATLAQNIVPTMTGYTTPEGVASASSDRANGEAWRAFGSGDWITADGDVTGWIEYEFTQHRVIRKYAITAPSDFTLSPKSWTFEGWDGNSWQVLDTQSNIVFSAGERKVFIVNTALDKFSYLKFRLNITANNGNANNLSVTLFEMMSANEFSVDDVNGQLFFDDMNTGRNLLAEYIYVLRSW